MIDRQRPPSAAFLAECLDWVARDPAVNNLAISLLHRAGYDAVFRQSLYLVTARGSEGITALACRSGFPKMVLAVRDDGLAAVGEIAAAVREDMPDLPCIMGPVPSAQQFVEAWRRPGIPDPAPGLAQLIYRLDRVVRHPPVSGRLELAVESQLQLVVDWLTAFVEEAHQPPQDQEETARRRLREESLFVWMDGEPVCLVGAAGPPGLVGRIGPVYTPPGKRRRGYAGAAVAAASQAMLDRGHPLCCLYTDAANPTANHIYQELGYELVSEVEEYWFTPELMPPTMRTR